MITGKVLKAIGKVKQMTELFVEAQLIQSSDSYNIITGNMDLVTSSKTVPGIIDNFDFKDIDNFQVLQSDIKFLVLHDETLDFTPMKDKMIVESNQYEIMGVKSISLGSNEMLYTLHLRR